MDEHEFLRQSFEDFKKYIDDKITSMMTEFKESAADNRQSIKELYEERNRIDKALLKLENKVDDQYKDINKVGEKLTNYIEEQKTRWSNVIWKIIVPISSSITIAGALVYLGLK